MTNSNNAKGGTLPAEAIRAYRWANNVRGGTCLAEAGRAKKRRELMRLLPIPPGAEIDDQRNGQLHRRTHLRLHHFADLGGPILVDLE